MYSAIAAAGAEDGGELGIAQHLLEVCRSFRVGAAEDKIFFAYGVADLDAKAPALNEVYGRLNFFGGDITRGAGDADGVACFQIGRNEQRERVCCRCRKSFGFVSGIFSSEYGSRGADGHEGRQKVFSVHLNNCFNIAA